MGQLDVACGWKPVPEGAAPGVYWPRNVWDLILRQTRRARKHGEAFEYRSIETDVLAFVLERATGRRLAQLVSEEIWQKIGAEESACFTVDPAGYALADGGFNATLRDYARFGMLHLTPGLVPAAWAQAIRTRNEAEFTAEERMPGGGYRNQFWLGPGDRVVMARGVFGQLIWIDADARMVVVMLASRPEFIDPARDAPVRAAIGRIGALLA